MLINSSDPHINGRGRPDGRQEHGDGGAEDDRVEAHRLLDLQQFAESRKQSNRGEIQCAVATGRNLRLIRR